MTLTIVEHDASEPALYGAMAAVFAQARGADLAHLPAQFDTSVHADAVQHVAAAGALVASGLVWHERLAGVNVDPDATVAQILKQERDRDIVVPYHPATATSGETIAGLVAQAGAAGMVVQRIRVAQAGAGLQFFDQATETPLGTRGIWAPDRFGRLRSQADCRALREGDAVVRVVLAGSESDHRDVYPAALAALGDAADAEGLTLDVVFASPRDLRQQDVAEVFRDIDGILLPGGSDMANVPGQILLAREALRSQTPAIGLCLGMQTMATAVAQGALGSEQANLAEADPSAPIKTFVPMADDGTLPVHRLGERTITIAAGSRLEALLGSEAKIRCNHRFRLAPELVSVLELAGMRITAHDGSGRIADAVEQSGHPFYVGMQGHPELSSRSGAPHPLMRAFLQACRISAGKV
jgi:gamma-glutamyl-gamma-aminobutyrate hydrolase PuuD